jgi:putative transposase
MSQQASPSAGKVYGLERVTRIWGVLGATIYRHREEPAARERPGPLGAMSDQDLVGEIRQLLQASPFIRRKISGLEEIKNRVVHADARHT